MPRAARHHAGPWRAYAFPDFPWPLHLQPRGDQATASQVLAYLHSYASHYGLESRMRFHCRVVKLAWAERGDGASGGGAAGLPSGGSPRDGGQASGWKVVLRDLAARGKQVEMACTHVVLAHGLHTQPYTPTYPVRATLPCGLCSRLGGQQRACARAFLPREQGALSVRGRSCPFAAALVQGQEVFLGRQVHARDFRASQVDLGGKDVLVMGNSHSVYDTLAEHAVARQAHAAALLYRRVRRPVGQWRRRWQSRPALARATELLAALLCGSGAVAAADDAVARVPAQRVGGALQRPPQRVLHHPDQRVEAALPQAGRQAAGSKGRGGAGEGV